MNQVSVNIASSSTHPSAEILIIEQILIIPYVTCSLTDFYAGATCIVEIRNDLNFSQAVNGRKTMDSKKVQGIQNKNSVPKIKVNPTHLIKLKKKSGSKAKRYRRSDHI